MAEMDGNQPKNEKLVHRQEKGGEEKVVRGERLGAKTPKFVIRTVERVERKKKKKLGGERSFTKVL